MKKIIYIILVCLLTSLSTYAQKESKNIKKKEEYTIDKNEQKKIKKAEKEAEKKKEIKNTTYKKRILESPEIDFLSSLYEQDGEHAAVSGGIGTESLQDATATIVIAIPIKDDNVLSITAGVSAYSSASSSNVNPFDGGQAADAFVASSGESQADVWTTGNVSYSHYSDDRNKIFSGNVNFANEYDYSSIGFGASFSQLTNQKNTEYSAKASAFFDKWSLIYPSELRSFGLRGEDDDDEDENFNINNYTLLGNLNYQPRANPLLGRNRNTYSLGFGLSQIFSKKLQGSLALDFVFQEGQLSTPFQRVYFQDIENTFIENFHLAEDIERLPNNRIKAAFGARLHYYINEALALRSFYRYYQDDWKLNSHTVSIELPIKALLGQFTFYPSYRYYYQSGIEHYAPYDKHLSTSEFYTSDYDLSKFNAHQYGFGISYNNIFNKGKIKFGELKSVDIKYYHYKRDHNFSSNLLTLGIKIRLK